MTEIKMITVIIFNIIDLIRNIVSELSTALYQRKVFFTRVNLYHNSHYHLSGESQIGSSSARVCACEMAFAAKSKTDRTDSRALRIVNRLAKESNTRKQIGGLVYSVHQTGYSAGRNSVMACNENTAACVYRRRTYNTTRFRTYNDRIKCTAR